MRRVRLLVLIGVTLAVVFGSILPARAQQQALPVQQAPSDSQNSSAAPATPTAQQRAELIRKRAEWFHNQRAYPFQHIPAGAMQRAIEQRDRMRTGRRAQSAGESVNPLAIISFPGDALWHPTGPQPTNNPFGNVPGGGNVGFPTASGRVTALAVDTSDTTGNTIYLGAAAGGVWKTIDGGAHWIPLTDSQPSLAVGSIAIDPNNNQIIYVGTGEENFNIDAYFGAGVLKSVNGGASWTQEGASTFVGPFNSSVGAARIGAIAVDPNNSQVILAGVAFGDQGSPSGIYRSTNGGANWTLVQGGDAGTAVVFDPVASTKTAYAALGFPGGDTNNGIYKSIDEGATWTKLTVSTLTGSQMGRITLAFAPSTTGNTATIYAAIADSTNNSSLLRGFFVTKDGGVSWTQLTNTPDFCLEPGGFGGQCFYDLAVAVHPNKPDFVVVGGAAFTDNSTTLFGTSDGGTTWSTDSSSPSKDFTIGSTSVRPHVDTHALVFAPNGTTPRLYVGDDGGIWRTDNPDAALPPPPNPPTNPLWVDLNATLALSQFYPGAHPSISDENWGFGGTQDNDVQVFEGTLDWTMAPACGDGGFTAVDPATPTSIFASCNEFAGAKVRKSVFYGLSTPGAIISPSFRAADSGIDALDGMEFIPPLAIDESSASPTSNSTTLYFGTCRIWQTNDSATTWTQVSGDLSAGNTPVPTDCPNTAGAADITSIDVTPKNSSFSSFVFAGTSNGKVWESPTFGSFWTEIDNATLPGRFVTSVRSKPGDTTGDTAYVAFSGYGSCGGCDGKGHIFKTSNATTGAAWIDISGNLPDAPVNDIIVDRSDSPSFDALYIATDVGVFSCPDPESKTATPCTNWTVVGDGLPNSPVLSLGMRRDSRILRAATHGRSMYDIQLTDVQPSALPALNSMTPAAVMAGSPTTTVTVTGVNFGSNTKVAIGSGPFASIPSGLTTTFVSTTQLTVTVPATLLTTGTVVDIGLIDPLGTSTDTLPFTVMNPIPHISAHSANPTTGMVEEPVTFNLTGTGFVNGTQLIFNGNQVAGAGTASNGGTTLTVTISESALTSLMAGTNVSVNVSNSLPGGGPAAVADSFNFPVVANSGPEAAFNPSSIFFFPSIDPGGAANLATDVQLSNSGTSTLNLATKATITGPNAGDFAFLPATGGASSTPACADFTAVTTVTITAGAKCFFNMTFKPLGTTPGFRTATLTVNDNGDDTPELIPITGIVNGPIPQFTASIGNVSTNFCTGTGCFPTPVSFGSVPKGTTSPVIDGTLTNAGSGNTPTWDLMVATISILNSANSGDFALTAPTNGTTACATAPPTFSLASFISCARGLTFTPSTAGLETATLELTFSNSSTAKIDVPLTGIGVIPTITTIAPSIVATGGPTFTMTVTGTNYVLGSVVNVSKSLPPAAGDARLTTFVSATQLQASIPASDITTAGSSAITVTNPSGGGTSEPKSLIVAQAPTGTNDNFANATDTKVTPFQITQDTTLFTTNTGGLADPAPACAPGGATLSGKAKSAWFKFVAPATGKVVADTRFSSYSTILSVWTGTANSLTAVAGACTSGNILGTPPESFVGFPVTSGTTYYLMVTDATASPASAVGGTLTFRLDFASAQPANDDFINAKNAAPVSPSPVFSDTVNTVLATTDTGGRLDPAPSCAPIGAANLGKANSVWYTLTPSSTTPVTADTLTSLDDTILSVWTGSPAAGFTQVACNDNAGTGPTQVLQSQVSFTATGGTTYSFMVTSVLGDGGTAFHLRLTSSTSATLVSIAVTPANPSVAAGKTQQFTATGTFSDSSTQNLTSSVTWASGTPANATINATGLATAVKVGTSTISATSGSVVGSTTLTVTAATLSSIAVTPANPSVAAGKTQQFTATGTFSDSSTQNLTSSVTWASGTPANATINAAGLATAVKVGTSTISATSGSVVGSTTLTVTAATLSSIAVTPANPSVAAGKTQQFTATGTFSDSSTQNITGTVTWASGTPANATINAAGLATAVKVGTSTISATSGSVVGSTTLTVTAATLSSIAVTPANPSVAAGKTQQFTATGTFSDSSTQNLTSSVTWASGTPANATINAAGLATAVKVGTSLISATSGSVVGSTTLTVTAATLSSIAVTPANPSVAAGKTQQFTATGTFSDSSTQNLTSSVTWASGTPANATINAAGLATAVKVGTSTISATSGSVVGSTTLTVTAATLSSIAVTPASPSILVAGTQQFTATGTFSDSSTQNLTSSVTWASGTPTVATINAAGLATAVKAGSSTISATSGSVVGSTTLTVANATLVSIAVTPANPSVAAGKTQQFTATGTFSDSSTQNLTSSVTWASGTPANATINAAGLATAVKVGTSTISATSGSVVGSTTLTVTAATLSSIAVTPANPSVAAGKTQQFTATGTFSDSSTQDLTSSVTWASGTPANATINAAGLATAVKVGTSTISATSGSVVGSTTLTVTAATLSSIAVTPANPSVAAGKTQQFTATGTFSDSSTQDLTSSVTWASGTPANATINAAGLATAVKVGTSTISATSGSVVGSTTLTVTAATLSSIAVTPANPSVAVGKTQQFTATGTFSDSSTQNLTSSVTWASGTPANATINAAGLATAVKVGTSTISATSGSVVGSTTLTVTAATLSSIAVTPASPSILVAGTQQFTATGTFSDSSTQNLTSSVTWASGTPTVATINAAGLATAVKAGSSTISATSGSVVGSTTLTVANATLVSIAVTPANPSVAAGKTQQFTATGTFSDSSTQNLTSSVTWASGTPANATINAAGLATAVKVGTSTISATSGSVVGSTTLTVTAATLSSIAVTPANPSVAAGKTQQFTATGTFSDSSTQDLTSSVTWASGTPANATINAAGLATAVKVGTSTISATSGSVVGSTTLTVTAATLSSIAVTPANPSIPAGKTQQFTATGTFSDSSTQNLTSSVTWSSSDTTVATINAAGLATGVKAGGPVTIKATSGSVNGTTSFTLTAAVLVSIAVTPANPSVAAGKTQQFTATGTFSDNSTQNLTSSVTWASGTPANATINAAGLATSLKVGTSLISATSGSVVGSTTLTVTAATLSSIAVTPATPTILVAGTQQFTATGTFSDNSTQDLTSSVVWASGTTSVATINAAGLATAVKAGSSTISATSGSVVGSTTLTVTNATLVSIAVTPVNPSVAAGKTQQFTATGTFSDSSTQNVTSTVTWSSSDTTIATINAAGLATGVKLGGPVTIKAASGSVNGTTTLTVTAAVLSSIAVTPANPSVAAGKTQQFTATGTFSDNSTQNLTSSVVWASGTTTVATINAAGLATTLKVGTSLISATSGSVVGSTTLTVTAATLSSIAVTPANPSVPAGKTQQFTATGTFSDNSTQDVTSTVTWASGTPANATINAAGLASTLKVGTSTISATSGSVVGSTTLTVTAATLSSIAVTPANPSILVAGTQQFTATGTFSDNSTQDLTITVTWASATPAVATINAAGLATGVKAGTSTISATSGSVVGSTTLTVNAPPVVTTNPANQSVNAGSNATFTAAASGTPAPTVQWQVSVSGSAFSNVPGATSTTLTFATTFSQNGNKYQAVFTNSVGTATTTAATLTVTAPDVTISKTHSGDFTVGANGVYTIKVTNSGTGPTTGNITVTDSLPAGLTFVSGTGANWACSAVGQPVTCTYSGPPLAAAGGNSTFTMTASVAPGAFPSVTNSATVADPNDSKSNDKSVTDAPTNIDNAVPTQSSFSPSVGLIAGATSAQQITLTGTGFNNSTLVTFGSNAPLTGTPNAAGTSLTISVPTADLTLANAGNVIITVTNPKNPTSNAGGGTAPTNLTFPLVGMQSIAPQTGTPNPVPIVAGTPFALQMNLNLTPSGATLPADVTIACSFPSSLTGATCSPSPGTIAHGTTSASSIITINAIPTSGGTASLPSAPGIGGRGPWSTNLLWLVAAALLSMLAMTRKVQQRAPQFRRAPVYLALVLLVVGAGVLVGCTTAAKSTPTPTGPSTITVTATTADGASVATTVNITISN